MMESLETSVDASWCAVADLGDLVRIFEPSVQICTWRRAEAACLTAAASAGEAQAFPPTLELLSAGESPGLAGLKHLAARTSMVEDVAMLGTVLSDLVGCRSVGLRVTGITEAMCPGWHVDRLAVRLICTYRGPGTEWLADQSVNRASLRAPAASLGPHVSAVAGEVVLLKGAGWPGNEHLGAVHRSPPVPVGDDARILATLDPLWPV